MLILEIDENICMVRIYDEWRIKNKLVNFKDLVEIKNERN